MRCKIQLIFETEEEVITEEIACFHRIDDMSPASLGLSLKEAKLITSGVLKSMISHQIKRYIAAEKICSCCNKKLSLKGYHPLIYKTLFGKIYIQSPRFYQCSCKSNKQISFSPLPKILKERISPELNYLQTKWISLMSYGMTSKLLDEVFPIQTNISSIFYKTQEVAKRLESELGEEHHMYIEGCPRDWEKLPKPDIPLTIGIDGGYIHAREGNNRKAGWFEAIVGKSLQDDRGTKRFGFVVNYDTKPKRRLYEMLKKQGMQINQEMTFLSDGADVVRELQMYLSPYSEHILDWFHITMRITVLKQVAKGLFLEDVGLKLNVGDQLDRIKWCLWNGNTFKALKRLDFLKFDLETFYEKKKSKEYKLWKMIKEFYGYIEANEAYIPDYGARYAYGESISTAFVESTVNEVISKRMVKKQQMRWSKEGAHLMIQLRTKTLNQELKESFANWYPGMDEEEQPLPIAA